MTLQPNARIAYGPSTCLLTYSLSTHPAELAVNVAGADPTASTLTLTIANKTGAAVAVQSIGIAIPTGDDEFSLATSIDNADVAPGQWQIASASALDGPTDFLVTSSTAAIGTLAAGALIIVTFSDVSINTVPGPVAIAISEATGTGSPVQRGMTITVVKYPPGFFFDSLIVNSGPGTDLQPVAQVPYNIPVTLSWNVAEVDLTSIAIFQSSNAGPSPAITPTQMNRWTTPAGLLADTIFTVVVTTTTPSGDKIVSAQSVAVSVHRPDAMLNAVQATTLAVGNPARTAPTPAASVTGGLTADTVRVLGSSEGGAAEPYPAVFDVQGDGWTRIGRWNNLARAVPPSSQSGGLVVGWNRSQGQAETNLFNVFDGAGTSFVFSQVVGTDCRDLVTIGSTGSLTVTGGVAVAGGMETDALAATGPVAVIGAMRFISPDQTYTAATDGFLCATVGPPPPFEEGNIPPQQWESVTLSAWFPANPAGALTAVVTGGFLSISIPDGIQMLFAPQSGMIPVAKGQSYRALLNGLIGTTNIWWVPLGSQS